VKDNSKIKVEGKHKKGKFMRENDEDLKREKRERRNGDI
jgi:hypothetical protein